MFEFHGWANIVPSNNQSQDVDDDLFLCLEDKIKAIHEWTRECILLRRTGNGMVSLTLSGLRNHRDKAVFELFDWLSQHADRSTGVLFTSDDEDCDRIYDAETHFRVFRLSQGKFVELDHLFEMNDPKNAF